MPAKRNREVLVFEYDADIVQRLLESLGKGNRVTIRSAGNVVGGVVLSYLHDAQMRAVHVNFEGISVTVNYSDSDF